MKLLCVVDMQRGFMTPETNSGQLESSLLSHIIPLIDQFYWQNQAVVFTKFHNTEDSPYCDFLNWRQLQQRSEQALLPELELYAKTVFVKYSYSIWTPEFTAYVKAHQVQEIYFVGMDTDACIYQSALHAFDQHIQPKIVSDACASRAGHAHHQAALALLQRHIGQHNLMTTTDVLREAIVGR